MNRSILYQACVYALSLSTFVLAQPSVPEGYTIEIYASGFTNPNALAFSPGGSFGHEGELFVGDARPDPGTIYRIPSAGAPVVFAASYDSTPRSFKFGPQDSAFEGKLYCSHAYEVVAYSSDGSTEYITNTGAFPWDIEFGPGAGSSQYLYYADGRDNAVYDVDEYWQQSMFIGGLPKEVTGLAFSPGGAFGEYLYLAFARGEGDAGSYYTPAIRRVDSEGVLEDFVIHESFDNTNNLKFDTTGNFRDNLFVSDSTMNAIWAIDPDRNVTMFASGFSFSQTPHHINDGGDLAFGPDGALYVADAGVGIIYRIAHTGHDCNDNGIPDVDEPGGDLDCNYNYRVDFCETLDGSSPDCNGNQIPDQCELAGADYLLQASFETGIPDEWSTTGMAAATESCSHDEPCDPSTWVYFGDSATCSIGPGEITVGTLSAPTVSIPEEATSVRLTFCSLYDGERGVAPDGFDSAWVSCNGVMLHDVGHDASLGEWTEISVNLIAFRGDTVDLAWHFDSIDTQGNEPLGWQVDHIEILAKGVVDYDCDDNGVPDECDPDCNGDGTPDGCEPDSDGDGIPDLCDRLGDFDHDADVDLDDYEAFDTCYGFSGPGITPLFAECSDRFDFDGDVDVDLQDFAELQRVFGSVAP